MSGRHRGNPPRPAYPTGSPAVFFLRRGDQHAVRISRGTIAAAATADPASDTTWIPVVVDGHPVDAPMSWVSHNDIISLGQPPERALTAS